MTLHRKRRWHHRLMASVRRYTLYWALIGAGLLLIAGAGTAAAAIMLSGRGTLVAPAYDEQQLQVTDERLSAPLTPGGTVDLLFAVRNPNTFPVRVDGIALASAMSKAKPGGCTAQVTGPVQRGYTFPAARRVTVPAGERGEITVPAAFKLAASARRGCGFTVDILVNATQVAVRPHSVPPSSPAPPDEPGPSPALTDPPITEPATTTPPSAGGSDEDPAG